jgi:hypothetical protein
MNNLDELAKTHCLHTLLEPVQLYDLYFTEQVKSAINFSLTGSHNCSAPIENFVRAAIRVLQAHEKYPLSRGFFHLDLSRNTFEPLWIQEAVICALKQLVGYEKALLLISGLRPALCPSGKYWTQSIRKQYKDALSYIDQLAANRINSSTILNLVYL